MLGKLLRVISGVGLMATAGHAEDLFDGKSLEGWSGDPRLWRVEAGAIVGETDSTDRKLKRNSFLIWKGPELEDFELTFQARVVGNNSGVQYRCTINDPATWVATGYQFDLHPKAEYLGMLYEEGGRGISCLRGQKVELGPDKKKVVTGTLEVPPVDLAQWNTYRLVAKGNRLQHFVNGTLAAEIVDQNPDKQALRGHLALQLHQGAPMKAEFKEIRLQRLPKDDAKKNLK